MEKVVFSNIVVDRCTGCQGLWFDLLEGGTKLPMGSEVETSGSPRFRVSAVGSFVQRPGCPPDVVTTLGAERMAALCMGECYHPSDQRHRIERIEIVRIRPQRSDGEDVAGLIDDPWRVHDCPATREGCVVEFEDPDFATAGRDAVYYARVLQEPTPHVNGDPLRCTRDSEGRCTAVRTCAGDGEDACLDAAQARAWSSPIFVDYR